MSDFKIESSIKNDTKDSLQLENDRHSSKS